VALVTERLHRGLFNLIDDDFKPEGALHFISNCQYRRGSNVLAKADGRSAFGTASADGASTFGLRDARFDNGNHYLIAHVSASYLTAAVGATGTVGILASNVGVGTALDVAHYRNRFILFNGAAATASGLPSNRVLYLTATAVANTPSLRQHGMLPTPGAPNVTASATSFSQTVIGYYEYWTTELAKLTQDGTEFVMEGGFSGNPSTIFVSSAGMAPVITLPTLANPDVTTHWRIYRSPKKERQSDKKFPTGFMIAELGTATANHVDSLAVSDTGFVFPANVNSGAEFYADFASASSVTADDGVFARATAATRVARSQGVYGFNFGGFAGAVRGIEVELQASAVTSPCLLQVRIGKGRTANGSFVPDLSALPAPFRQIIGENILARNTVVKGAAVTATAGAGQVITLGGSSDRWFASNYSGLVDTDFSGNFMIVVTPIQTNAALDFAIDYVKAKVYYGGSVDSSVPFPTVAYTFGDITAQVSKNGPPPSSSTGDIYEDTLVVNDIQNPGLIRYSYPGDPEAFPGTYYLDFETRENDRVTNIKTVNNRLIVMLERAVYRVNYLPSERDASFDRGKAIEPISSSHGCVNEMCACVFSPEGGGQLLAFVSDNGLHVTDGYSFDTWSQNIIWRSRHTDGRNVFGSHANGFAAIALIDDRENQRLKFFYRNGTTAGNDYLSLHISYGPRHLIEGAPTIAGRVRMDNYDSVSFATAAPGAAWSVQRADGFTDTYIGYLGTGTTTAAGAGRVYRESSDQLSIPASASGMGFRTRRISFAGYGQEVRINALHSFFGVFTSAATAEYRLQTAKTGGNVDVSLTSPKSLNLAVNTNGVRRFNVAVAAEMAMVSASVSGQGADVNIRNVTFDVDDFGATETGG